MVGNIIRLICKMRKQRSRKSNSPKTTHLLPFSSYRQLKLSMPMI